MQEIIGYTIVVLLITGIVYSLIKIVQQIIVLKQTQNKAKKKRVLNHYYLMTIALVGFLLSFVLNIIVYMGVIRSSIITGNATAISCFIFLMIFLIAKLSASSKVSYKQLSN